MRRKVKLDVVMTCGAIVRLHVTEYTISYNTTGAITKFNWKSQTNLGRSPVTLLVDQIAAIVRVSR